MALENPNNLDLNLDDQGQQLDLNFEPASGDEGGNGAGGLTLSLDLLEMHATPAQAVPEPMERGPAPGIQPLEGVKPSPRGMSPQDGPRLPEITPPSMPSSTFFPSEAPTTGSATTGAFPTFPGATAAGGWSALENKSVVGGVSQANRFDLSSLKGRLEGLSRPLQFLLVFAITAGVAFFFISPDSDFLSEISLPSFESLFGSGDEDAENGLPEGAPDATALESKVAEKRNKKAKQAQSSAPVATSEDVSIWQENPYWALTNGLDGDLKQVNETWTPEQEQGWRTAITGAELWPKYRTLFQVRGLNLKGSQLILKELALSEKFWLRAMALMALADFGDTIPFANVEIVVKDVDSELLARFVSRFEDESTPGERYILREMIRIADERGRMAILRAITAKPDKYTPLYLVAGTFDPNSRVQKLATRIVREQKVERIYDLQDIVRGVKTFEDYANAAEKAASQSQASEAQGSNQQGDTNPAKASDPAGALQEAGSAALESSDTQNSSLKANPDSQAAANEATNGEAPSPPKEAAALRENSGDSGQDAQSE